MANQVNAEPQIRLPKEVLIQAQQRADSLGLTLAEYVETLVQDDVHGLADPWRQPLPWEVEKQYLLDEIEFYEQEKKHPQKAAHTAVKLMELLDGEIEQLDSNETD